ncbi:MAG: nuclear transport factor 2 family protein [Cyclobacteriaceae bacterium]|nr:nuclear transport factor 2 family protein [Cyclobacteriaceae bacterium]
MKLFFTLTMVLIFQLSHGQEDKTIHQFIDNWHLAAARADATIFFESLAENSVYIGTDASERWTKTEFLAFAKPYFDKGKAWDFKPYDRDLHVTKDAKTAWFSELLTTWMGVCRGSGILIKTKSGWRIEQYHLSVTVPNEIINNFIALVKVSQEQVPAEKEH